MTLNYQQGFKEGKIILYKGAKGRGKTLTMVKDAYRYYLKNWNILSNMNSIPFAKPITTEEILNLNKNSTINQCILVIDEIQIFFDSRRSIRKENLDFSNFIQQVRKRGIILLCTTQYANTVDLRLRQHIDILVYPFFNKTYNACKVIYVDMNTIEDTILGKIKQPEMVTIVFDTLPIYKLYDTHEVIT